MIVVLRCRVSWCGRLALSFGAYCFRQTEDHLISRVRDVSDGTKDL